MHAISNHYILTKFMRKNLSISRLHWLIAPIAMIILLMPTYSLKAQNKYSAAYDSTYLHKNNVKVNLSAWVLYDNVTLFSYERSISRHQTISLTGGSMLFPSFSVLNISNVQFQKSLKRNGFTIGAEYRFYLAGENKFAAPHGLYVGPYLNYYHFDNERSLTFTDSSGEQSTGNLSSKISVVNLGIQIGYQFVLWKRFTVDLVLFAPSISRYSADFNLDGNLTPDHQIELNTDIVNALKNRFPLLSKLISEKSLNVSGDTHNHINVIAPGIRYSVFVGYRF
jgi:Protein of unknown function (DUF3575)